jgi:hypothetical protein
MRSGRAFISCSFDITDEVEVKLFNHVQSKGKGKISRYIRRLIYNDVMNIHNPNPIAAVAPVENEMSDDVEALEAFL